MVKVKDTETFIQRATAIHGNRYDYSQTEWAGSGKPVVIICKVHGKFTLAWAASHYNKKGSGCQKCSGCEAKVRDTESFIEYSKSIHGDKYDYSQSVYLGSDKPIVIVCKNCGPITIHAASAHYSKLRCGCKHCKIEQSLVRRGIAKTCDTCGTRIKYCGSKTKCEKCLSEHKQVKGNAKERLRQRPCKNCGKPIGTIDKRRVVCSVACGHAGRSSGRVSVACVTCGKLVQRYVREFEKYGKACCSIECQNHWAMKERHSSQFTVDWHEKSQKAKRKWKAVGRKRRKEKSIKYKFWLLTQSSLKKDANVSGWQRKCSTASQGLKQRLTHEKGEASRKTTSFQDVVKNAFRGYAMLKSGTWEKKCYSTVKNMKWKRRLRNVKRNFSPHIENTKAQPKQLLLWE